ncbi:hypothetical protein PXK56_18040 [Phaeobacter gallaeciensis]|uniref:hypothetical protein n=1 Tax=Phaeobacter gallaeciensis TaxID=60890 RepID=UPI0023801CBF|nr:hypothetical protein [Phaeobacter gallaeciensis]MDE4297091.1 hypothetical protein [Phaeobacter gallaeciensis]
MNFYPENYDVTITVPFTDPTGAEVTPSAATAKLLDGDGAQIVDLGALTFAVDATSVGVTIDGAHNTLPVGEQRAVRILSVTLTLPGGDIERRFAYAVETTVRLEVMTNSFMTYESAQVIATDFVNPVGWAVAEEAARKTALVNAYQRLTQIPMKYNPLDVAGEPMRAQENVVLRDEWIGLTYDDFAAWPAHFRLALRRAQFIEANGLLQGDPLGAKRRAGITSETIGESSVRIDASMVDYGVSTETLSALAGYIYFNMRIGRA